jgi:hypothetical protein
MVSCGERLLVKLSTVAYLSQLQATLAFRYQSDTCPELARELFLHEFAH